MPRSQITTEKFEAIGKALKDAQGKAPPGRHLGKQHIFDRWGDLITALRTQPGAEAWTHAEIAKLISASGVSVTPAEISGGMARAGKKRTDKPRRSSTAARSKPALIKHKPSNSSHAGAEERPKPTDASARTTAARPVPLSEAAPKIPADASNVASFRSTHKQRTRV